MSGSLSNRITGKKDRETVSAEDQDSEEEKNLVPDVARRQVMVGCGATAQYDTEYLQCCMDPLFL